MEDTDDPRKCHAYREDYLECLHHRKEVIQLETVPDLVCGIETCACCKIGI